MAVDPKRAEAIFLAAIEQPDPAARRALLDRECGVDQELRQRVEGLLQAHDEPGTLLEHPPISIQPTPEAPSPGQVGQRIGPYRLTRKLGEGGMGEVYLAEQTEPVKRQVALKIIKPGMDSRQVIARFQAERQALALMDHPNVARVLDAGTTAAGRPYFVMELVDGVPITQYCDDHRLTAQSRLRLFVDVCHAVQHAHQKGIIHRDLKPSNVLVAEFDGKPSAKVIDFGIAKAVGQQLTEKTIFTAFGQVIGTVEYMSPEQAQFNQLDIDTRSDVYSLGVILYELLTGHTPFDRKRLESAALDEVLRIIREEDPQRPSTRLSASQTLPSLAAKRHLEPKKLTRLVRGELDWIVMKALEKDRGRRYESPNGLATDIMRYLADEPVIAAAPSRLYRLRKFVRRNKAPVLASLLLLLVLIAGTVGTTIGLIGEARQRREAQNQAAIANAVGQFQAAMLSSADPARMLGDKVTVVEVMLSAARELDEGKLRDQPLVEIEIRNTIGLTLQALGRFEAAEQQLRKALELRRKVLPPGHAEIGTGMNNLAGILRDKGNVSEAEPLYRELIKLRRAGGPKSEYDLACALNNLGLLLRDRNRYDEAEPLFRESMDLIRRVQPADDPATAQVTHNLAGLLYLREDPSTLDEAERLARAALASRQRALPPGHPNIAESMGGLAMVLQQRRKFDEAEKLARDALELRTKVLPPGHPDLASSYNSLAFILKQEGRFREAADPARKALELARAVYPHHHPHIAFCLENLADLLVDLGEVQEAFELYRESLDIRRAIFPPGHPMIAVSLNNLAATLEQQGELNQAELLYVEALQIASAAFPAGHIEVARNEANLGHLLVRQREFARAELLLRDALIVLQKNTHDNDWRVGITRTSLGLALTGLNRFPEAQAELLAAERVHAPELQLRPGRYHQCVKALAQLYIAWDQAEPDKGYDAQAAQWRAKLLTTMPAPTQPATQP